MMLAPESPSITPRILCRQGIKRIMHRWPANIKQQDSFEVLPWDCQTPSVKWLHTFYKYLGEQDKSDLSHLDFAEYALIPVTGILQGERFTGLVRCDQAPNVVKLPTQLEGLSSEAYSVLTRLGLLSLWEAETGREDPDPTSTSISQLAERVSLFNPQTALRIVHANASSSWETLNLTDVHTLLRFFAHADLRAEDLERLR